MIPVMHGECVSAILPAVMEYNWMGAPEKYARIARALGVTVEGMSTEDAAKAAVIEVEKLVRDLNIPTLRQQGADPEQIDRYAKAAFEDPQTFGNPRDLDLDAYKWIYRRCFGLDETA